MQKLQSSLTRRQAIGAAAAAGASFLVKPASAWSTPFFEPPAAAELPRNVLYCGSDHPPPLAIELTAGPLSMIFEPGLAFLRYIRMGEREVLRGVYSAVRDHNWGTVSPRVFNLKTETTSGAFRLSFDVECTEGPVEFFWKGAITGDAEGTIRFTMDGEARSSFTRNRIGFCILHPIEECAGRPCTVEKVDGTTERGAFPDSISPHQPFFNMRAISHTVAPGVTAEVRFEGDTFEMEDQRNWTDASYKTYCTPLGLPFPVAIKRGARISQSVTVKLKGQPRARPAMISAASPEVVLRPGGAVRKLPLLGLGLATGSPALSRRELARLRAVRPAHVRVDLRLSDPGYQKLLQRAAAEANALGASIEAALFLTDAAEDELRGLAERLDSSKPKVARWLIFHVGEKSTTEGWVRLARRRLPGVIGAGTNANFTELNRDRPSGKPDVICYSANPQVHAFDNASLVETFEGLRHTLSTARQFSGSAQLAVTPVTFKPRFNPSATTAQAAARPGELPRQVDARQMSLFGAAWTLGSLQALAEGGADSLTFYETTGWRGLMETERGSRLPAKFQSIPGAVFPLYHVLADAGEFAGGEVMPTTSSQPLRVTGMTLRKGNRTRLLLANLGQQVRYVRVVDSGLGGRLRLKRLDEHTVMEAMQSPEAYRRDPGSLFESSGGTVEVALLPYAYARIDPAEPQA